MAGRLIGLIPRNFVIVLIENHIWYQESTSKSKDVSMYYRTAVSRQESVALSERDGQEVLSGGDSPKGSIYNVDVPAFGSGGKKKVTPAKEIKLDESIQRSPSS